ncbi:MAG: radical SAM protein [Deltaproteobacteria bacterium]|nr:radical SAM protein [Deltaproteobacteria bacterium]
MDRNDWRPRNCVWELTLACNLRCVHCGSRAGLARERELTTAECLDVVSQLAELGCELVTLSGGEPTLRRDWDTVARAVASRGLFVNMVTHGAYPRPGQADDVARRALDAGLCNVGVSVDGPQPVHDSIRGEGTFARTLHSIDRFRAAGLPVTVMTTVGRRNLAHLESVRRIAIDAGAGTWRLQLAKPMGSARDEVGFVLQPRHLLELLPLLAELKRRGEIALRVGDSIGYYGPHDRELRGRGWRGRDECWQGCQAGMQAIGIEASGDVKGCLSLQAKWGHRDPFVEGNLRERRLTDLWYGSGAFAYNRDVTADSLTGHCRSCRHAVLCRGGARCVSAAFSGLLTESDYCYYHVAREQLVPRWRSAGQGALAAAAMAMAAACGGDSSSPATDAAVMDGVTTDLGSRDAGPADVGTDAPPSADTGPTPDAGTDAGTDAGIDCSAVCCECEYGIIPPEVFEQCCAPDPCAGVCCECDYGEPPPPQCCP